MDGDAKTDAEPILGSSVAKVRELAGIKLAFKNVSTLAGERRVHSLRSHSEVLQANSRVSHLVGVFMVGFLGMRFVGFLVRT